MSATQSQAFARLHRANVTARRLGFEVQEAPHGHVEADSFRIWDRHGRYVVAHGRGRTYGLALDEVERWLTNEAAS